MVPERDAMGKWRDVDIVGRVLTRQSLSRSLSRLKRQQTTRPYWVSNSALNVTQGWRRCQPQRSGCIWHRQVSHRLYGYNNANRQAGCPDVKGNTCRRVYWRDILALSRPPSRPPSNKATHSWASVWVMPLSSWQSSSSQQPRAIVPARYARLRFTT